MLAAVWALSGLWAVSHAIAHEMEHEGHHVEGVVEGSVVSIVVNDGHGHAHPDSFPVVSTGKAPKFGAAALLVAAPELACSPLQLQWGAQTAPARASPRIPSSSGPRAPPLS